MGELFALMNDVTYLASIEGSKNQSTAFVTKKIVLPDPSVKNVMKKYLEKAGQLSFEKIFVQKIGFLLFKEFCRDHCNNSSMKINFYESIEEYENMDTSEERLKKAQQIYDHHIMPQILNHAHHYSKETLQQVQRHLMKNNAPVNLFRWYVGEIFEHLKGEMFERFLQSEKFTRFCQWKNFELNMQLTMDDFFVHRHLGRGGFGLVSGVRKQDTGRMYAMKCMEKKRIKKSGAETLVLNERMMLSLVSTGDYCPFVVGMIYAFQTSDKLLFVLDLLKGGDLYYHLEKHGGFTEAEMKFYACEIILGLEHMHNRCIVYRDLKPPNILLEENGHIRISDFGLACDFSTSKPRKVCGTRGFMAPEMLMGESYDSSVDWFSFGCTIFVLLFLKSPFKHGKYKSKEDLETFLETMRNFEPPSSLTVNCKNLFEQLLKIDVNERLGCKGKGAVEVKEHPFFNDIDWQKVFLRRYTPPLVPERGQIHAHDHFDIGNDRDERKEVKGLKLTPADEDQYKNFEIIVSERWQEEIVDTIFENVNIETDKLEQKKRTLQKVSKFYLHVKDSDVIVHGYVKKLGGPFTTAWQIRYGMLYPSRLELHHDSENMKPELFLLHNIDEIDVDLHEIKNENCIIVKFKDASTHESKLILTTLDEISLKEWHSSLRTAVKLSTDLLDQINPKAIKIYGINRDPMLLQ